MKKMIGVLLACVLLSGCAGSPIRTGWQAETHTKAMIKLQPDMSIEEVVKIMGNPDKTEMYRGQSNEAILVYLYITEGMDTYSRRWTEANYTPVVFVNGKVQGWGWSYLNGTAKKYEITVKNLY